MKLKKIAICSVICAISFAGGWGAKHYLVKQELEQLVVANTRTIHAYALTSMTQTHLADYMLQTLNTLAGRPVKELPENFSIDPDWNKLEREAGTEFEDVPVTVEQAIRDSREFEMMFKNFTVTTLMQADTMKTILKQLQAKEKDGN